MPRIDGDFLRVVFSLAMAAIGAGACGGSPPDAPVKPASFRSVLAKTYAEGHPVSSFDVGDIDGDGHLDVVANELDHLAIFRGDGSGALANDPLDGGLTHSFHTTIADVTGDGRADVLTAGEGSGNVRIFPGRADGTLGPSVAYGVPAQFISRFLVVDMTGDGTLDLLIQASTFDVTMGSRGFLAILPNRGNGVFDEPLLIPLNVNLTAWAAADLDGDGATDVAIADPNTVGVLLLMNDGQGHLSPPELSMVGPTGTGALFAGDFDGDGRTDLVKIAADGGQLAILRNMGGGTFQSLSPIELGCLVTNLLPADLNNDGRTDVAAVTLNGALQILHADGVTLIPAGAYATGGATAYVRAGDFDRDGAVDLAIVNGTPDGGNLAVLMNDGRGLFEAAPISPVPGEALTMGLGDVTRDGLTDIVVSAGGIALPSLITFASSADGKLRARSMKLPIVGGSTGLAVGDLNGDQVADVLLTSPSDGRTLLLTESGGGQLAPPTDVNIPVGDKVAIGDLDGDAFPDVAVGSIERLGDIQLFSNHGNGSFGPLQSYHAADGPPAALRITDLNGDGRSDVVSSSVAQDGTGTGAISILASSGPSGFAAPTAVPVIPPVDTFLVADLDQDGRADLVGSSVYGTEVPLLFGAARGRPFTRKSIDVGAPTIGVARGDFNRDGWTDLAFADQGSGDILVLVNDHRGGFPERQTIPLRMEPRELAAVDLNGDGKVDLAVLTPAGVVVLWNTSE